MSITMHSQRQHHAPLRTTHNRVLAAACTAAIVAAGTLLTGCRQTAAPADSDTDSLALHIALLPTADCLPFYVAQQTGIYDSLGLDLRLHTYQAQLDTDTALLRHHAHLAYTDIIRALLLQQRDSLNLRVVAATAGTHTLLTPQRSRTRRTAQLRERMVAVARHSVTDFLSDALTDSASLARNDIFRPQINSLRIRTDMLCNATLDAAFLPEPYATEARLSGHTDLYTTSHDGPRMLAFATTASCLHDSLRQTQLRLLLEGYEAARQAISEGHRGTLPALLTRLAQTPDTLADTIATLLPAPQPLLAPRQADAEAALQWLHSRHQARTTFTADTLLHDITASTAAAHNTTTAP